MLRRCICTPPVYRARQHCRVRHPGPYLDVVQAVEQRRFLHAEVVGYQGVEAIGEIQDVGLGLSV